MRFTIWTVTRPSGMIWRKTQPTRVASMTADLNGWKNELAQPQWSEAKQWFKTHSKNHIKIIEGTDGR